MPTAPVRIIGSWEDSDEGPAQGTVYFQRHDTIQEFGGSVVFAQIERARLGADGTIDTEVVGADPDDPNPLTRFYRVTERIRGASGAVVYDIELDAETGTVDLTSVSRVAALPQPLYLYASAAALAAEAQARAAADADLADDITSEAQARVTADAALSQAIADEAETRAAADAALSQAIADAEPDLGPYARKDAANTFLGTGLQKIDAAPLPLYDFAAIMGGAEFHIVSGVYSGSTFRFGYVAARLDLSGVGGNPNALVGGYVYKLDSGSYLIDYTTEVTGEPTRVAQLVLPNLQIANVLTGNFARTAVQTAEPLSSNDAAPLGYVDAGLAAAETYTDTKAVLPTRLAAGAMFRALAQPGTSPRFQMCGDADVPGSWSDAAWTTPSPGNFVGGAWIRCYGVNFSEEGLPADPEDGQQVYSEKWSWPMPETETNPLGSWDAGEFARLAEWVAAENRWKHLLFFEASTTSATQETMEDVRLTSTIEVPAGVRITSVAVWVKGDNGDGQGEVLLLVEVPSDMADFFADGSHWLVVGRYIHQGVIVLASSVAPWHMGADLARTYQERMEVRNGGPAGALMASPDAAEADLVPDGDPFDDDQTNTWTPLGSEALVVPPA